MKQTAEVRGNYQSSPPSLSVYDEARITYTRSYSSPDSLSERDKCKWELMSLWTLEGVYRLQTLGPCFFSKFKAIP